MLSNECHPDVCDTMKATDDAEFFCAAHPKAQPVNRYKKKKKKIKKKKKKKIKKKKKKKKKKKN